MADPLTGVRASAAGTGFAGIISNARVVDMSDVIHLLDPNEAPLTAIMMKMRTVSAISPKVEWMEDDYIPNSDTINDATVASGDETFTVSNGPYFRPGDIVEALETSEIMYVRSISTDALTVSRSIGATAAAALANGGVLFIIGNANQENSTNRSIFTALKLAKLNFAQIFRWEFGASGTLQASELYGGDDLAYQRRKAGKEFRIQLERSYIFGEQSEQTTDAAAAPTQLSGALRTCDGMLARATLASAQATVSQANFDDFLRDAMRYGPARKMLFASRHFVSWLNTTAVAKIETRPSDESFPLALTEYKSPHGKVYIATHNQLIQNTGTEKRYQGYALCLDMDSIFHRPLRGRNTMLRTNIQANDADGRIDGYLAECCPQIIQSQNHRVWIGATATG